MVLSVYETKENAAKLGKRNFIYISYTVEIQKAYDGPKTSNIASKVFFHLPSLSTITKLSFFDTLGGISILQHVYTSIVNQIKNAAKKPKKNTA